MTHTHETEYVETTRDRPAAVNVNEPAPGYVAESPMAPVRRVVGLLFGILLVLIGLRILLLALGANQGNALVDGIYGITEIFVAPFRGVFTIDKVSPTGASVFDVGATVAFVGWALIGALVLAILRLPDRRTY